MEDKVFGLLEKMYIEMQELKTNMATKIDLDNTRQDLARLENKMDNHFNALFDGYKQSIENIADLRDKLEKLTDKVENQEIKLQILKSVK